jgi:hypothetical protein
MRRLYSVTSVLPKDTSITEARKYKTFYKTNITESCSSSLTKFIKYSLMRRAKFYYDYAYQLIRFD